MPSSELEALKALSKKQRINYKNFAHHFIAQGLQPPCIDDWQEYTIIAKRLKTYAYRVWQIEQNIIKKIQQALSNTKKKSK